ncbi:DUF2637 domain-containing protein [Nocardia sp. NPDC003963]
MQESLDKARKFWWWVLGCSAGVSVIGNAIHAYLRVDAAPPELLHPKAGMTVTLLPPLAAAGLAALVPIALLVHTHGLALLLQAPSKYGWLSRIFIVAIILLLGIGGFVLSFAAMTELAMMAGIDATFAWLYSVLVDGSIAGATIALLSLPHTAAAIKTEEASNQHQPDIEESGHSDIEAEAQVISLPGYEFDASPSSQEHLAEHAPELSAPKAELATESAVDSEGAGADQWAQVANELCENTTRDSGQVAKILHLAFHRGLEATEIATQVGMRERAVRSLLEDAQPYHLIAQQNIARVS